MSHLTDAVLRRIKEHTFFYELNGVLIEKAGYANRYMGGINAMYKVYNKLKKKYSHFIGKTEFEKYPENQEKIMFGCAGYRELKTHRLLFKAAINQCSIILRIEKSLL